MKKLLRKIFPSSELDSDLQFMSEVDAATHKMGSKFAYITSVVIFMLIIVALLWARFAVIDEVTRGVGQIVPSQKVQVIQNLEGGIVEAILVADNQIVDKGDVLLRINNTLAASHYRDTVNKVMEHRAIIIRLLAEAADEELVFPEESDIPLATINSQKEIYQARKEQVQSELTILNLQLLQRQQEITEMVGREKQLLRSLANAQQQIDIVKPLHEKGLYPEVDYLRVERDLINLQGEVNALQLGFPRAQQVVKEMEQKTIQQKKLFRTLALDELNQKRAELKSLQEAIAAGKDRVTRTDVRSPVRGTVKQINITTIGGVIHPGESILEIVPLDDTLLIEARIRPSDIAFLHPGQKAMVKITAYDFSIYGGMEGIVEQISADTIMDEKGNSFFKVKLRTKSNTLLYQGSKLPIIPGMVASVDIQTGEKTVLDYLLKPILKAKQNALRER